MAILIVIVSVIEIVVGSTRPGSSFAQGVGGWGERELVWYWRVALWRWAGNRFVGVRGRVWQVGSGLAKVPLAQRGHMATKLTIQVRGCRAKEWECLRQRCVDKECPWRPEKKAEGDEAANKTASDELPPDDKVAMDFGMQFSEDEGEEGKEDVKDSLVKEPSQKTFPTQLYPVAYPQSWQKRMLSQGINLGAHTHLLVLTRSPHPSVLVAARDYTVGVYGLIQCTENRALLIFEN